MNNIVFFGPAHSGKTTCVSYIYLSSIPENERTNALRKAKERSNYIESYKYAYVLDTAKDEGPDATYNTATTQGTSRYMHLKEINIIHNDQAYSISMIDTPGAEHRTAERVNGISYGDIGVFIIELAMVLDMMADDRAKESYFYAKLKELINWVYFGDSRKLIIAISKMDMPPYEYNQQSYILAKNILSCFVGAAHMNDVEFVPISVQVREETDSNVVTKSNKLAWYSGPTLLESIERLCITSRMPDDKTKFVTCSEIFENPSDTGPKYRGKVLQGTIKRDDIIKIVPFNYRNSYIAAYGKVRTIRNAYERIKNIEFALTDDIIGMWISFRDPNIVHYHENGRPGIVKASIVVDSTRECAMGNLVRYTIAKEQFDASVEPFQCIGVYWFGRIIYGYLLSTYIDQATSSYNLIVEYPQPVALPRQENSFIINEFVVFEQASQSSQARGNAAETSIDDIEFIRSELPVMDEEEQVFWKQLENEEIARRQVGFQAKGVVNKIGFLDKIVLIFGDVFCTKEKMEEILEFLRRNISEAEWHIYRENEIRCATELYPIIIMTRIRKLLRDRKIECEMKIKINPQMV